MPNATAAVSQPSRNTARTTPRTHAPDPSKAPASSACGMPEPATATLTSLVTTVSIPPTSQATPATTPTRAGAGARSRSRRPARQHRRDGEQDAEEQEQVADVGRGRVGRGDVEGLLGVRVGDPRQRGRGGQQQRRADDGAGDARAPPQGRDVHGRLQGRVTGRRRRYDRAPAAPSGRPPERPRGWHRSRGARSQGWHRGAATGPGWWRIAPMSRARDAAVLLFAATVAAWPWRALRTSSPGATTRPAPSRPASPPSWRSRS